MESICSACRNRLGSDASKPRFLVEARNGGLVCNYCIALMASCLPQFHPTGSLRVHFGREAALVDFSLRIEVGAQVILLLRDDDHDWRVATRGSQTKDLAPLLSSRETSISCCRSCGRNPPSVRTFQTPSGKEPFAICGECVVAAAEILRREGLLPTVFETQSEAGFAVRAFTTGGADAGRKCAISPECAGGVELGLSEDGERKN